MRNSTKNRAVCLLAVVALVFSAAAIRYAVVSERPALGADGEISKEAALAESVAESAVVKNPFGDAVLVDDDSASTADDEVASTEDDDAAIGADDENLGTGASDEEPTPEE